MSATKKKGGEPAAVVAVKAKVPAVHTPGPWQTSDIDTRGVYADGGAALVATVHTLSLPECEQVDRMEVTAANARLIAASPDLLREARLAVRRMQAYREALKVGKSLEEANLEAAILKATTETP